MCEKQFIVVHPLGPPDANGTRRGRVVEILGGEQGGAVKVGAHVLYTCGGGQPDPDVDHLILSEQVIARLVPDQE
jgi:hypothetical protein